MTATTNARDQFKLPEPFIVSFSGGLTSAYMGRRVLDAHGGRLPDGGRFIFCNTGKERPETLDFIERCSQQWDVPIVWLEYRRWQGPLPPQPQPGRWVCRPRRRKNGTVGNITGLEVVDYASASRNGEPFDQVIGSKPLLPNVVMRYCTEWLKVKTSWRYVRHILGWRGYTNAIGLRADEPRRVAKLRPESSSTPGEEPVAPLHKAGVTREEVLAFWSRQSFRLNLRPHEGNCDICFLKGLGATDAILRDRPDLADWWISKEEQFKGKTRLFEAGRFRKDRPSYKTLLRLSKEPQLFPHDDERYPECRCTD